MKIEWSQGLDASCWHTLLAYKRGFPLIDGGLASQLPPLAASCAELAESAAAVVADGVAPIDSALAKAVAACRRLLAPQGEEAFAKELRLRCGPIRDQWDARGPGLMRQIGRLTEPAIGRQATVSLVAPVVGGHGEVLAGADHVTFEAVLTNPVAELPEVLRLAWLLAQLPSNTDSEVSQAAVLAATLAAAEEVELATLDGPTAELALDAWRVTDNPISTAAALLPWWSEYRGSPTPWPMAVADLGSRLA